MIAEAEVTDETRQTTRTTPSLFAVVKIRPSENETVRETADVASLSSTGAGFYISRECKTGQLVSLTIPLEDELRAYDQDKEMYRVWGLVQHCHRLADDDAERFHVGVAFIGKHAPESYDDDPNQSYRICGMGEDGLWKIVESREFTTRKDPRFYIEVDHYLAVDNKSSSASGGERTKTENISKNGAAVLSSLNVNVGERVKFISEKYDFSGLAVVCNSVELKDGRKRLHLRFVENSFPIEKLESTESSPKPEKSK